MFDILPLHGVLQPGETQQVQFTFYGHAGIATEVVAGCKVEGGPVYQLRLKGEASDVQYKFNTKKIDLGNIVSGISVHVIAHNMCVSKCIFMYSRCTNGLIIQTPNIGHVHAHMRHNYGSD